MTVGEVAVLAVPTSDADDLGELTDVLTALG